MREPTVRPSRRLAHTPALDGIRAIAVLVVTLWHFSGDILETPLGWLKAGHLGVDIFFVLSGFLITALLLDERERAGRISIRGFYRRRAFRILPALIVFLAAQIAFFVLVARHAPPMPFSPSATTADEVASVVAVLLFVVNLLAAHTSFVVAPGLGHLWSLSVEEQFYLVWPTVMVVMLGRSRRAASVLNVGLAGLAAMTARSFLWDSQPASVRRVLLVVTFAGLLVGFTWLSRVRRDVWTLCALVTCIAMVAISRAVSYSEGRVDPISLYVGTLSRADALLVGALLAILWCRGWIPPKGPGWLAVLGWIGIVWAMTQRSLGDPFFFRYGWTLVAVLVALTVWAGLGPEDGWYGRTLSWRPLRAIGKVSFGLYLWHALVFQWVDHEMSGSSLAARSAVALGVTAAATALSWYVVEKPMIARKNRRSGVAVETPIDPGRLVR